MKNNISQIRMIALEQQRYYIEAYHFWKTDLS